MLVTSVCCPSLSLGLVFSDIRFTYGTTSYQVHVRAIRGERKTHWHVDILPMPSKDGGGTNSLYAPDVHTCLDYSGWQEPEWLELQPNRQNHHYFPVFLEKRRTIFWRCRPQILHNKVSEWQSCMHAQRYGFQFCR